MRFYLDTEFSEDGRTIDLISIGVVAENGREFYRQNSDANLRKANSWVQANVVPKLWACRKGIPGPRHTYGTCADDNCVWRPRRAIMHELFEFVGLLSKPDGMTWVRPEFWGYYADYDWVAVCQLFGTMMDLPKGWPMYCRDIKQLADDFFPGVRLDEVVLQMKEHNALSDARWNRWVHHWMISQEGVLEILDARRKEAGSVDQEPEAVRSVEAAGQGQGDSSSDKQRLGEEVPVEEVGVIHEEGVTFV